MATEQTETSSPERNPLKIHYFVELVEKTSPPEGMAGDNWHSYIIGNGSSIIEGKKPGSLKSVKLHAQSVVDDLNSRADIKNRGAYAANKKRVV